MIAIDSIKQQALDANPRAIQQINFNGNLDRAAGTFHSLRSKINHFRVFTRNCKSIVNV